MRWIVFSCLCCQTINIYKTYSNELILVHGYTEIYGEIFVWMHVIRLVCGIKFQILDKKTWFWFETCLYFYMRNRIMFNAKIVISLMCSTWYSFRKTLYLPSYHPILFLTFIVASWFGSYVNFMNYTSIYHLMITRWLSAKVIYCCYWLNRVNQVWYSIRLNLLCKN